MLEDNDPLADQTLGALRLPHELKAEKMSF